MELTYTIIFIISVGFGLLCGLIPLIFGFRKNNLKFGLIGFVLCIVAGLIGSLLLALPTALIFTWFFFFRKTAN